MALVLMCLAAAMVIISICCLVYWDPTPSYTIREDRVGTIPPAPNPEPEAETWTRYDVPLSDEVQRYISAQCREHGLSVPLVLAVIEKESDYDTELVGDGGKSWGLMQIYATEHIRRCVDLGSWNLLDPCHNVRVGIDYLAELMATRNVISALMAYNAGPAAADEQLAAGVRHTDYTDYVLARAKQIALTGEEVGMDVSQ